MCGIAGVINIKGDTVDRQSLIQLNSVISHRGPDDEGYYIHNNVGLVHRRLSIVDLSTNGHQPMISHDGNFIIVFNGEIYNHGSIRKKLVDKGYIFESTSDTNTLLNAYAEYGEKVVNMLNGIFSFAIFDKKRNEVFIARDNFGIKPLYFSLFDNRFVFSSELKSFIALRNFKNNLDYRALLSYVNFLWCPGFQTPFAHVHKLLPGHYIKIPIENCTFHSTSAVTNATTCYYDVPFCGNYLKNDEHELTFMLDYKLNKAVERQLMSDVPLGFFISGGLDSSLIAAIAQKLNGAAKINAFTIDPGADLQKEGFSSDLMYSQKLARHLKFDLNVISARTNILSDFDKMIWHLDEPQADPAPLNVYQICASAKQQGIKVLLGGVAGDDLFSGYRRHQALYFNKWINHFPTPIVNIFRDLTDKGKSTNPIKRRLKKMLRDYGKDEINQMVGYFSWINVAAGRRLFSKHVVPFIEDFDPADLLKTQLLRIPNERNSLNKLLYLEMKSFLPDHNLNYTDKLSMAAGVETRVPYLDKDLVKFSTEIPPEFKLRGSTTKYLLKCVAEKYLPKEIIYRKKAGFGAPLRRWILHDMRDMIADRLSPAKIEQRGLFSPDAVKDLIEGNQSGKFDASYIIWSLLSIDSWMRQFVDGENLAGE